MAQIIKHVSRRFLYQTNDGAIASISDKVILTVHGPRNNERVHQSQANLSRNSPAANVGNSSGFLGCGYSIGAIQNTPSNSAATQFIHTNLMALMGNCGSWLFIP